MTDMNEIEYIRRQYALAGVELSDRKAEYIAKIIRMIEIFAKSEDGEYGMYVFGSSTSIEDSSVNTYVVCADTNASHFLGILPHILKTFVEVAPNDYKMSAGELLSVYNHLFSNVRSNNATLN